MLQVNLMDLLNISLICNLYLYSSKLYTTDVRVLEQFVCCMGQIKIKSNFGSHILKKKKIPYIPSSLSFTLLHLIHYLTVTLNTSIHFLN